MSSKLFRKLAHLEEQLGTERLEALIDSSNTGKVREFCDALITGSLPSEMTVNGRTYELLDCLRKDDVDLPGHALVKRAVEMNANLGGDDGFDILIHQDDIPKELRGKVIFAFTGWHNPEQSGWIAYLYWSPGEDRWAQHWGWINSNWKSWSVRCRLLRRKS